MPSFVRTRARLAGAAWCAGAGAVAAQPPAHLTALTVPPPEVGTCVPARASRPTEGEAVERGHRLVMTSRSPRGRREITVYTDARGALRRYAELTHHRTGSATSVGEHVVAGVTGAGQLRGSLLRTAVAMEAPPWRRLDSAALRRMREQARTTQAREPLGAREQAQVRTLAAWLVRRCPTEG